MKTGGSISRRGLVVAGATASSALALGACAGRGENRGAVAATLDALPAPVTAHLEPAMWAAIAEARQATFPFGAVLVDVASGQVVTRARNTGPGDPTAHAEVNVIRAGAAARVAFARTVLVSTAESCPMCAAAAVWAGVSAVVFGTSIAALIGHGWGQIDIAQATVAARSTFSQMPIVGNFLAAETDPLYAAGPPRASTG
jgi:tRNA(Arg) A34 adenosine deaminase TadA